MVVAEGRIDLAHLPRRRRIVALTADRQIEQPVTGSWPRLASDLPAGEVTDLVAPAAWIRALIPYASTQAETTTYAIRNGDGKTVVRVHWTTGELTKPSTAALPARVGIEVLRGYGPEAARVRRALTRNTPLAESDRSWFDDFRAVPGLGPGRRSGSGCSRTKRPTSRWPTRCSATSPPWRAPSTASSPTSTPNSCTTSGLRSVAPGRC